MPPVGGFGGGSVCRCAKRASVPIEPMIAVSANAGRAAEGRRDAGRQRRTDDEDELVDHRLPRVGRPQQR